MASVERGDRRASSHHRRTDVSVAIGTAAVSVGLMIGLPPVDLASADSTGVAEPVVRYPVVAGLAWTVSLLGLIAQSVVLLIARRRPRVALTMIAVITVLVAVTASSSLFGISALPVVVAVVLAALRMPFDRLWPAAVGAAVLVAIGQTVMIMNASRDGSGAATGIGSALGQGALQGVAVVGLPLVITLVVQSRREVRRAREAETAAVGREADARIDAAIARERSTMARELHDIVAHHLSGLALMTAVIDRQIDTDPEAAHVHARQAREQSTAVLEDLRRLVGLLREDGAAERSVETFGGLSDLVDRARLRGPVELRVLTSDEGRPLGHGIGPLAQLAGFRTVQESLANAALHAPGAATLVTVDDRDVRAAVITVRNTAGTAQTASASAPTSSSGGYGLLGMRERADLVRADLRYGRTDEGGWQVQLTLDRDDATGQENP